MNKIEPLSLRRQETKKKSWISNNWGQILVVLSLIVLAVLVLYPLVVLLIRSFRDYYEDIANPFGLPSSFTFENYVNAWPSVRGAYINSFVTTIVVTIGTVILSSFLAYAFVRFNFRGKKVVYYMIIAVMMVPSILTLITRYQEIYQMGLLNTYSGIILPGIAGYIPASFVLLFTFFAGIPKELFEAAEIDGASDFKTYVEVVLPLSKPILWTIAIQTFVGEWNDFLWAKVVLTDDNWTTLPIVLTGLIDPNMPNYPFAFAGYVLSSLPLIILFVAAGKQFISGMTSGAVKM